MRGEIARFLGALCQTPYLQAVLLRPAAARPPPKHETPLDPQCPRRAPLVVFCYLEGSFQSASLDHPDAHPLRFQRLEPVGARVRELETALETFLPSLVAAPLGAFVRSFPSSFCPSDHSRPTLRPASTAPGPPTGVLPAGPRAPLGRVREESPRAGGFQPDRRFGRLRPSGFSREPSPLGAWGGYGPTRDRPAHPGRGPGRPAQLRGILPGRGTDGRVFVPALLGRLSAGIL